MSRPTSDSTWRLNADLMAAWALVWIARFGRNGELTQEAHQFFADRYHRLSDTYRARNRLARAERLDAIAREHDAAAGNDGPPFAAAMALPRPKRFIVTNAVSTTRLDGPDDAA